MPVKLYNLESPLWSLPSSHTLPLLPAYNLSAQLTSSTGNGTLTRDSRAPEVSGHVDQRYNNNSGVTDVRHQRKQSLNIPAASYHQVCSPSFKLLIKNHENNVFAGTQWFT